MIHDNWKRVSKNSVILNTLFWDSAIIYLKRLWKIFFFLLRDLVISEFASRIQKVGADQKFAVHFCFLDSFWFQYSSFLKNIVCQNEFPNIIFHYSKSQKLLMAAAYVPEVSKPSFSLKAAIKHYIIQQINVHSPCFSLVLVLRQGEF